MTADVLVIGAGPAGMAAAVRARESGAEVVTIDDNPSAGGQIWRGSSEGAGDRQWRLWSDRFAAAGVRRIANARAISADAAAATVLAERSEGCATIRFRQLVLATGARELFLPFPGWTLPGVTGAGGLQALVKGGVPVAGKRVVVAGSGPLLLAVARHLQQAGAEIAFIAEQAPPWAVGSFALQLLRGPGKLLQAAGLRLGLRGVSYRTGCWVEAAEGNGRLERVRLRAGAKTWWEKCDFAAIGFGLWPNSELGALFGCALAGNSIAVDEMQATSIPGIFAAGECCGIGGLDGSLLEGEIAGYAATGNADRAHALFSKRERERRFAAGLSRAFKLRPELKALPGPDTLVCRCEDVPFQRLAEMDSFRAAKLHTRCGMGPCQGRVCGPAAAFLFGWAGDSVRPPLFPARVRSLIGETEKTMEVT